MQGFNMGRYVPPDLEGTVTSGNKVHGKHALGARASKLASQGILTVRFEMPFAVWCGHCPKPTIIGQGVRFNAEKRRVGSYFSSPIFAFRMRHAECGGALEIRTDPQNTAYVVTEGGKRRDTGDGKEDDDNDDLVKRSGPGEPVAIMTDRERDRLRGDAFAKLETTIEDRAQLERARHRIGDLEAASSRAWEDPYARNRALRQAFRSKRHALEEEGRAAEGLRDRMSLGIELVPASEEDARRAALVDFGDLAVAAAAAAAATTNTDAPAAADKKALSKPLFGGGKGDGDGLGSKLQQKEKSAAAANKNSRKDEKGKKNKKRLKSEIAASQIRENFVSEVVGNTRVTRDPFLSQQGKTPAPKILGIKRKRQEEPEEKRIDESSTKGAASSAALVEYDSDSA
ncbi:putative duf455 domain protein [Eutypa lata UCREL1]|uniref:Putative duf455 domain protein n=1 Tax=Eutypa lata (strain UCR-EL1) TaxID=1287681 RepID=M7TBE4_EUTLA|nr:putative duf455 domain protein [Eutypa lata UCREL1]